MDPFTTAIILIAAGFLIGILATLVGIGGGLANVPFLIYVMNVHPIDATLISSFTIVFTASSGTLNYYKQKRIDYKTAIQYLMLAIPGSILGGYLADAVDVTLLKRLFAVVVIIAGIRGIRKAYLTRKIDTAKEEKQENPTGEHRNIVASDGTVYDYHVKIKAGRIGAFFGGMAAGFFGLGGGIIFMPLLTAVSEVPVFIAVPTSAFMIVFVSIIAVITRVSKAGIAGTLDPSIFLYYGIPLAIGSIIGARFGSSRLHRINSALILGLFWTTALLAGIRMIIG